MGLKKILCASLCLVTVLSNTAFAQETKEYVSDSIKVIKDGTEMTVQACNIDGYNYFKLRDMSALLKNSDSRFSVKWDEKTGNVNIYRGRENAGDLEAANAEGPVSKSGTAVAGDGVIYADNVKKYAESYIIDGYNYYKLRDLAEITGFNTDWDAVNSAVIINTENDDITPWKYQSMLGRGMDVDWSKTKQGTENYNEQTVIDFASAGVSHVRIRIADDISNELLESLDKQINDCLNHGIIPIIAYQADDFKNDPSEENTANAVNWWKTVAERYKDYSKLLSFDLLIEASDSINKQPDKLNEYYERAVTEIRKTNPERIIFISPIVRSDPAYLSELKIPTDHNGYLMAEWHFYAAGPSKTNDKKLWTTGTDEEKALITDKINTALKWQEETGIPTWVGAWMAGNYNDGDDYSVKEQVVFATFMTESLDNAGIPFAVNSDTKFYDREKNKWIGKMEPLRYAVYGNNL